MNESLIFTNALRLGDSAERSAYIDRACGNNLTLRAGVEALLRAHASDPDFLDNGICAAEGSGDPTSAAILETRLPCEKPGAVLGPYKLLEQIGEGGMGVVFMAEQAEPVQRRVALKIIKPGMDSRQVIGRFAAEKQALALMDHINIARVLDAGVTDQGRPYFVMELVHGVPITQYCDDNHLTPRQRLELFVPVCQAIQHAHQKGIIHRDIKPSNVMVTLYDGKPVPKVIDFGVAKAVEQKLTEQTLFTQYGTMVGTLEYMSPEQAEMSALGVDTRSDIYSLGVLLYELLTGSTPLSQLQMKDAAYGEILRLIREEEPPKPSTRLSESGEALASISAQRQTEPAKLSKLMRGELDWIVMKTLEKDRSCRYETAKDFAADVQRYLGDEPVQACPPSILYRFRKVARRHKGIVVSAAAVASTALMAVAVMAVSIVLVSRTNQELIASLGRERQEGYYQRITVADRDLSTDNLSRAWKLLEECPEPLRNWEWRYLMRLCRVEPLVLRDNANVEVNGLAFSPDGELLASAGADGTIRIRNSRTGGVVQTLNTRTGCVVSVAFHPDGKHLASAGAEHVKVWDLSTGLEAFAGPCDALRKFGTAYTVAFSRDGRQLAAGSGGAVRIWDWNKPQLLHTLSGHETHSIPVAFSPHEHQLVTSGGSREGQKLWDTETGKLLRTYPAHRHPVSALTFSPNGRWFASASFDRSVNLWDIATGKLLHKFQHTGNVLCIAFTPDGQRLASAGEDKTVHVWDTTTGREVLGLRGHTSMCGCVAFSPDPDGHRLASASKDGTIRIWDASPLRDNERQEALTFVQHKEEIRSVAFSPDGDRIASAGSDKTVKVWDAGTGHLCGSFSGHDQIVFCLAWQPPHGQRIASAGSDGPRQTVQFWDVQKRRADFMLPLGLACFALAFSPDGRYLATGRGDGALQIWVAESGQIVTLGSHIGDIRGLAFSPDGRFLASASSDGLVKVWDATRLTEKQEARLTVRARVPGPSLNVAFSPDGDRLATAAEENTVKIWNVQTAQELLTLRGHSGEIYALAFSPSSGGRWIASAGEDSAVKVWDSHTGKLVRNFRGHTGLVTSMSFSPDGRRLASGSRDTTVKIWDMTQLDAPARELSGTAGAPLSQAIPTH